MHSRAGSSNCNVLAASQMAARARSCGRYGGNTVDRLSLESSGGNLVMAGCCTRNWLWVAG